MRWTSFTVRLNVSGPTIMKMPFMPGRAKLAAMALVIMAAAISGCVHHKMGARAMIADMQKIHSGPDAMINILWYEGSDRKFDYFGYVYAMFGTKGFKVPVGELELRRIRHTDDEMKWVLIKEVDGIWVSSRLDTATGAWRPDSKGIRIEMASTGGG